MDVFIARQPIFDHRLHVFGYELLFRSGPENYFSGTANHASSRVITDSTLVMDLKSLTGGRRAFINFSRTALVEDFATILPKNALVVEIVEDIEPDREVVAACKRLKANGYQIALDDYVHREELEPLLEFADYVKVDFLETPEAERAALARRLAARRVRTVAEKVETLEAVAEATRLGYSLFQGYFFARPEMVSATDIPGFRLNYMRLLQEVYRPNVDVLSLESIIKQELSISYRLLRYINSVAFGFKTEVQSLRHALVLAGVKQVRKWASVWAIAGLGSEKPRELLVNSVIRARFCEQLGAASTLDIDEAELFLTGIFSLIDAVVDRPMETILLELPVSQEVRGALLGEPSQLRTVLDCVVSYERGDWTRSAAAASDVGITEQQLAESYMASAKWAREVFRAQ